MSRKNWDKKAKDLFSHLPKDYQDDWEDLRNLTVERH